MWSVDLKRNTVLNKNRISKLNLNKQHKPVKILFDFDVYFVWNSSVSNNGMSETDFVRQWKWSKDRLFDVCILNLIQFCNFDFYTLRHISVCSESCLYDILKR